MSQRQRYHPTDFGDRPWARLLDFALERSDHLECAIPYPYVSQDLWSAPLFSPALEALRGALVDRHVSMLRAGQLREEATQFLRFRMTPEVAAFARSIRRLEGWSWERQMPEDPVFLSGEVVLLSTESVQGRIAVYADREERDALRSSGVRLVEPLGVQAKPWPTP